MHPDFDRVEIEDVSRNFGRRRAVSHVTLTLRSGDIVGLLGPNGAGKSTLIGMLATLTSPSSGTIKYGQLLARPSGSDVRRRIGLLAHELHLYPELTARQNLAFFAHLYDLDVNEAVSSALDLAELADRGDDQVSTFSRGMRQRLAFERALLHKPRLLLLDEPFTGLDDRAVSLVSARLKRISAEGVIIVLATHDLDLVDGLITQMAVVRAGRLLTSEAAGTSTRQQYRALVERS